MDLLLSVLAAGSYTVGGLFMRKSQGFGQALPTVMVFACFGVGATLQTLAMRRSELSVNYVLVLGMEAGLALVLGVTFLGEAPSAPKLAGLALILAGILSLRLAKSREGSARCGPWPCGPTPSVRLRAITWSFDRIEAVGRRHPEAREPMGIGLVTWWRE